MLSQKNPCVRDADILFDEPTHIYTVKGEQGYTSTTTWIHSLFPLFDSYAIAEQIIRSPKMKDPTYKYYGKTVNTIQEEWKENGNIASRAGTQMHEDIENYYNGKDIVNHSKEFQYFRNYVADFPELVPYRTEWMVYDEEIKISGSIDMLYEKPDGTLIIADWKRAKEILYDNPYKKTGILPMVSHIPDTNFWHYALQLNIYRAILEKNYGKKVSELYLVRLHPDDVYKNYEKIEIPMMDTEIHHLFQYRKNSIM